MNKRKIMLLAVSLCMVAILGFGGTLAYLQDTDTMLNTFTSGQVGLLLDEAKVEKNEVAGSENYGDFLPVGTERVEDAQKYERVFPGNKITKDPTITLDDGSEISFVAAKITVKGDLLTLIPAADGLIDITKIVSGGLVTTGSTLVEFNGLVPTYYANGAYVFQKAISDKEWELYVFMEDKYDGFADDATYTNKIVLFDTITIPETWDNAEMKKFNGSTIDIKAFAVQADGFADCYTAMTTAFPTDFAFGTN